MLFLSAGPAHANPPVFVDSPEASDSGVVELHWKSVPPDESATFELEHLAPGGILYVQPVGKDHKSVRSGLVDGVHRFRVRQLSGTEATTEWSPQIEITNRFLDFKKVRLLLFVGGLVVLSTVIAILRGHLAIRSQP